MIRGVSVTVLRPVAGGRDRLGNETSGEPIRETVDNVLIAPGGESGTTSDMEAQRTDGDTLSLQVHFPKTYTQSLRGCTLELPGRWAEFNPYRVEGNPMPYIDANTPTSWHMPVRAVSARG